MSKTKPDKIYLTDETGETTWCQDKITDEDTEYIRIDLIPLPDTQERGWHPIEDGLPAIGQTVLLFINRVVQKETFILDSGDTSDYAPPRIFLDKGWA